MRRFVPLAFLGAVLTLAQPSIAPVAFGQESGTSQDDNTDQAPPDMTQPDQVPPDPAGQDQAPAQVADDAHWWLKRGGSASNDVNAIVGLQIDYGSFWRFRTSALAKLDTIYLEQVMVGKALSGEEGAVQRFKAEGKAQIVVVENHEEIWYLSPDEALVYDPYVSRSYFVDAKTRAPLGDGPNTPPFTASMLYHMTKQPNISGELVWKVDDAVIAVPE